MVVPLSKLEKSKVDPLPKLMLVPLNKLEKSKLDLFPDLEPIDRTLSFSTASVLTISSSLSAETTLESSISALAILSSLSTAITFESSLETATVSFTLSAALTALIATNDTKTIEINNNTLLLKIILPPFFNYRIV